MSFTWKFKLAWGTGAAGLRALPTWTGPARLTDTCHLLSQCWLTLYLLAGETCLQCWLNIWWRSIRVNYGITLVEGPSRQWPEVYDLCHTFLHVAQVKQHTCVILAWQCVVWLAQHAKTFYKIWYLRPLPRAQASLAIILNLNSLSFQMKWSGQLALHV